MPKIPAKAIRYNLGGVALDPYITSIEQSLDQELPDVTCLSDTGPRRVAGNYDHGYSIEGADDFGAATLDATLFAMLGSTSGSTSNFRPTGAAVGANDPHYNSTQHLESYSIKAAVGGAVMYSASLKGHSVLTRSTA